MDHSVLVLRSCCADHGNCTVIAYVHFLASQVEWKIGCILMHFVHLKYIISRSKYHIFVFSQDHRLQNVDYLSDVRHFQTVGIFVEYIEA